MSESFTKKQRTESISKADPWFDYIHIFDLSIRTDDLEMFKSATRNMSFDKLVLDSYHSDTVLHIAARSDSSKIAKYLIDEVGCDVDILNSLNCTPLHIAIDDRCGRVAKVLVEAGADTRDVIKQFGEKQVAIVCGDLKKVKELFSDLSRYEMRSFCEMAAASGWLPIVSYLFKEFKIQSTDPVAKKMLRHALIYARVQIILWLMTKQKVNLTLEKLFSRLPSKAPLSLVKWILTRPAIKSKRLFPLDTFFAAVTMARLVEDERLKLNGENIGNTCCKLIRHTIGQSSKFGKVCEIDLRDNPRIGKKGVDALIKIIQNV